MWKKKTYMLTTTDVHKHLWSSLVPVSCNVVVAEKVCEGPMRLNELNKNAKFNMSCDFVVM